MGSEARERGEDEPQWEGQDGAWEGDSRGGEREWKCKAEGGGTDTNTACVKTGEMVDLVVCEVAAGSNTLREMNAAAAAALRAVRHHASRAGIDGTQRSVEVSDLRLRRRLCSPA